MSGPTLLQPGSLIATKQSPAQGTLDTMRPVDYIMNWVDKHSYPKVPADRILIIKASTGSGKTTIVPPEIYRRFYTRLQRNIACTQPRVINAIQIPYTILEFNENLKMGDNIGYQTGSLVKKPIRGIIFMTVGLLLQQLNIMTDEEFIRKYSVIIIDEAHELSIATEIVLMLMRDLIQRNCTKPECPYLIVMSATFVPEHFRSYLLGGSREVMARENIINVRGFTFPITDIPLKVDSSDMIGDIVGIVKHIHVDGVDDMVKGDNQFRDILVFVGGIAQIRNITTQVERMLGTITQYNQEYPLRVIPLTGDIVKAQTQEYRSIFASYNKNMQRRLIIGTNVAETGITIDTLKYVIDTGFYNSKEYNPEIRCEFVMYKGISDDMRMQRRGRVGRKHPGTAYTVYTSATISAMNSQAYPEMYRTDIAGDVLILLDKTTNFDLLSPLPAQLLDHVYEKLWTLGMITANREISPLGRVAKTFRFIPVESVKMILSGLAWNHNVQDLIDIAAVIETFDISRDREQNVRNIYSVLSRHPDYRHSTLYYQTKHCCDFVMLFHLFKYLQGLVVTDPEQLVKILEQLDIAVVTFHEALKLRDEIIYAARSAGVPLNVGHQLTLNSDPEPTKRCIYEGYKLNLLYRGRTYNNVTVPIADRFLADQNYIIYKKLVYTKDQSGKLVPNVICPSVFDGIPLDYRVNL